MRPIALLLATSFALAGGSFFAPAEARDGCGRGMFYNGYRCVPQRYERGPDVRFYPGGGDYRGGYGRGYDAPRPGRHPCRPGFTVQDGACKPYTGR